MLLPARPGRTDAVSSSNGAGLELDASDWSAYFSAIAGNGERVLASVGVYSDGTAEDGRRRHGIVEEFLLAIGVSSETARIDAEGIEHHVSAEAERAPEVVGRIGAHRSARDVPEERLLIWRVQMWNLRANGAGIALMR